MATFHPISPRAARQILEEADSAGDCGRLLADFAQAGLVKAYARFIEKTVPESSPIEVRDSRIDRAIWKLIVAEGAVDQVYATGSIRVGSDTARVTVIGIRFDEKSVRAAAALHGTALATCLPAMPSPKSEAALFPTVAGAPAERESTADRPKATLDPSALSVSIDDASSVLGLSRGTIYKLIGQGRLVAVRIGARRLVKTDSIRALLG